MRLGTAIGFGLALLMAVAAPSQAATDEPKEQQPRSCYPLRDAAPAWTAVCIGEADYFRDTCRAIQFFAWRRGLPAGFFARLIWQESHFDPHAISVAGAQGIAQFMPSTARIRGLRNSFDPAEALAKSADYLHFLVEKFGNLGLAAAAYNGGENRVARYTASGGNLPWETRSYVEIITGRGVEAWTVEVPPEVDMTIGNPFVDACVKMAEREQFPRLDRPPGEWKPWGVMLAQNFSQEVTVRRFERVQKQFSKLLGGEKMLLLQARNPSFGWRMRHIAMIGRNTRKAADDLCAKLQAAGGSCMVRKN